jgi:hypothetical protein
MVNLPTQFSREELNRRFDAFIATGADRYSILTTLLDELGLSYEVRVICGNRHFLVSPDCQSATAPATAAPLAAKTLILVAHYDRVAGSAGANDNSAAVFELLDAAGALQQDEARWVLIILTDKEELAHGEGIMDQGSYTLAKELRTAGMGEARVFIFDACGTGDTLIISTTADYLMQNETGPGIARTRLLVRRLRTRALETARHLRMDRVKLIPTPFSDDAGFLRAGLAAQTITMLPASEAAAFADLVRSIPAFAGALVMREAQAAYDTRLIPQTWRRLNGPEDSRSHLTPENFPDVVRFIRALCRG